MNSQETSKKRGPYRQYLVADGDCESGIEPPKVPKSTYYRWKKTPDTDKLSECEESSDDEHAEQEAPDTNDFDSVMEGADSQDDDIFGYNSSDSEVDNELEHNRDEEQPLYETSLLTVGSAMLLIMTSPP